MSVGFFVKKTQYPRCESSDSQQSTQLFIHFFNKNFYIIHRFCCLELKLEITIHTYNQHLYNYGVKYCLFNQSTRELTCEGDESVLEIIPE